jgi:preprotein translocase subunit SecB
MIEAPRLLFPFARQVISEAVSSTGFPPLMLDPIDFAGAYLAQVVAAQGQGGVSNGSGDAPAPETPSEA